MQPPFSCVPHTFQCLESTLSAPRLGRYLGEAKGDKHYALRLYVWNGRLCEAFYLPSQMAEVATRNAIHKALIAKHGDNWFERGAFLCALPERLRKELNEVMRKERETYGAAATVNHFVSGLTFGFWIHLLTAKFDDVFWPSSFASCFPNKPRNINRQALYDRAERLRVFRNRLAHHKPIFDRAPKSEYQNLLELVKWVCVETHWFTLQISHVDQTINAKPPILPTAN